MRKNMNKLLCILLAATACKVADAQTVVNLQGVAVWSNVCVDAGSFDSGLGPQTCTPVLTTVVDAGANSFPVSIANTRGISGVGTLWATDAGAGVGGLLQLQTSEDGFNWVPASVNGTAVGNVTVAAAVNTTTNYSFNVPLLDMPTARVAYILDGGGAGILTWRWYGKQLP